MHELKVTAGLDKPAAYGELKAQLTGLYLGERDGLANAANLSALLYHSLPDLNWAGFYLLRGRGCPTGYRTRARALPRQGRLRQDSPGPRRLRHGRAAS
jgi:hypothetical protein